MKIYFGEKLMLDLSAFHVIRFFESITSKAELNPDEFKKISINEVKIWPYNELNEVLTIEFSDMVEFKSYEFRLMYAKDFSCYNASISQPKKSKLQII